MAVMAIAKPQKPRMIAFADPGELDHLNETVDEDFDRTY
jgi:hypothetical protein